MNRLITVKGNQGCRCKMNSNTSIVRSEYQTVPADLKVKIQPIFYSDPIDAVFKALGAE